jgi:ferric-dicitrate binding protein FerR (iron transport regulator)
MTDDDSPELDDRERAALATWDVAAPPPGFTDRALPATTPLAPPQRPRRSRAAWIALCAGAAALALSGGIFIAVRDDVHAPAATAGPSSGAVTAAERRTLAIGGRAVVVADAGAVLAWAVDDQGAAHVDHGAGAAFYRVDHGRPFVVTTPLGEVTVTGTCFRIEVIMRPTKHSIMGGAIGATLAAAVVVTVYEGGVVVAGSHGGGAGAVKVAPGERATLTPEGAPAVSAGNQGPETAPPLPSATRDQLLARDELQRQRIAGLTARIGELERVIAANGGVDHSDDGGRPWADPGPEQLAEWAKSCKVRFDMPPISSSTPFKVTPAEAAEYGIADTDIDPINSVLAELHRQWTDRIRAIYLDVVGEGGDTSMSAQAMMQEIEDKSPPGERAAVQQRIAQERAGLVPPPADWSRASPIERMMRSLAAIGEESERAIAKAIGVERARELRWRDGGWPAKMEMSGCEDLEK